MPVRADLKVIKYYSVVVQPGHCTAQNKCKPGHHLTVRRKHYSVGSSVGLDHGNED